MTGTLMEVQVHMAPNREMPPLKSPDPSYASSCLSESHPKFLPGPAGSSMAFPEPFCRLPASSLPPWTGQAGTYLEAFAVSVPQVVCTAPTSLHSSLISRVTSAGRPVLTSRLIQQPPRCPAPLRL